MEESILNKQAAYYTTHSDQIPTTHQSVLSFLSDESAKALCQKIKQVQDSEERKRLKAVAKCMSVSCSASKRGMAGFVQHTGLIAIDIDFKDNEHILQHPDFFITICNLPWIAYFGKSISGTGYFGIVPISNPLKHVAHFDALISVFASMKIQLDKAPRNVSSLRYQSFDEQAYFNHSASRFPFLHGPENRGKSKYKSRKIGVTTNLSPFDDYNANGDIPSLLVENGWLLCGNPTNPTRLRFTRPGKTSGVSVDWHTEKRILYVFSSNAGFDEENRGYNPVQVFYKITGCNNYKECNQKLIRMGYGR